MATTRLMPLHTGQGRTVGTAISIIIDYVKNPEKTDSGRLITGYKCDSRIADAEFLFNKKQYAQITGRQRGTDDVIACHLRQSFVAGEVTPEEANRIGCELARLFTKGNHAFIVTTHIDKQYIPNHFVLHFVSYLDGKKYNDCKSTYALMRKTSDELCFAHGLSVIQEPERGRTMSYDTWAAEQCKKPTWYGQIRQDVDSCITRAFLFDNFLDNLRKQGYDVKEGQYLAVRSPGKERFVRLKTLVDNYTEEAIRQ